MKIFFCKLRDALGFHITPTTIQPKARCVCALGLRSWAPGTSFAEKTARRNVAPERWVFLAGTGEGLVLCWCVLPISFTHGLALLSHYYKSSTCVCSVIFSLQRRCMGVLCCYFRPKMFSPGDHVWYHSRTLARAEHWGPPRRQGLGSHYAHMWATSDFAPRSAAVGIPETARVTQPLCPQVGHF